MATADWKANLVDVLEPHQRELVEKLLKLGQKHLFEAWPAPGERDTDKLRLVQQLEAANDSYPGGLKQYIENSRKLLEASRVGANPFSGYVPSVPLGERLTVGTSEFSDAEARGLKEIGVTGFVLVAGGLGERLGYKGIKIGLPAEITTASTFASLYIDFIMAFQSRARASSGNPELILPLAIMTSGDTHSRTVQLLEKHNNFGMEADQITLIKQEKVPSLLDNDARFALDDADPFELLTKPHGHGDVHTLMHSKGVLESWRTRYDTKWILFFQDTNALVFRAVPAAIGISSQHNFCINSVTVPRRPGEAVGGICCLTDEKVGRSITINVEYNQLDPLLRATTNPAGDVADAETGYSPFPGNINVLVFNAEFYQRVLDKTGGAIPEFINPKYANKERTIFKSPTRLECMMQDFPKLVDPDDKVGFTQLERWISFSAVKNNIADGAKNQSTTGFAECASSGEADIYSTNFKLLETLGKNVKVKGKIGERIFAGVKTPDGPKVVLSPSFGVTQAEIAERLTDAEITITPRSFLVLQGSGITIGKLDLDGTLIIRADEGATIRVDGLSVQNKGWKFRDLNSGEKKNKGTSEGSVSQVYVIRGYDLQKDEERRIEISSGDHVIDE